MSETNTKPLSDMTDYELAQALRAIRTAETKWLLTEAANRLWYLSGKSALAESRVETLQAENIRLADESAKHFGWWSAVNQRRAQAETEADELRKELARYREIVGETDQQETEQR